MAFRIVPGQGAVQINANPVVLGDKDRFGAGIKRDPSAGIALVRQLPFRSAVDPCTNCKCRFSGVNGALA